MITVRVRYVSPLISEVTGIKEEIIELAEGQRTVACLLELLCSKHGPAVRSVLLGDDGQPRSHIHLVLNGVNIRFAQGLDTVLEEGDSLAFVMPMSGGLVPHQ